MNEATPGARPERIGIYGGTFDPVHHGHLVAASEVWATLRLDRVIFMPAGRPPHKRDRAISPGAQRLAMLERAIAGRSYLGLSSLDLAGDRPAYTADLLARLRAVWGAQHELFFVLGEDALRDFPGWHTPEEIAALAHLVAVARPRVEVDLDAVVRAVPALAGRIHLVAFPELDIASSDLRARVASGRPIAYQVPPAVEEYILEQGLYRERHS